MKGCVQIVGRLPVELNRRVRAAAKRRKISVNAFLIEALTQARAGSRGPRRRDDESRSRPNADAGANQMQVVARLDRRAPPIDRRA